MSELQGCTTVVFIVQVLILLVLWAIYMKVK